MNTFRRPFYQTVVIVVMLTSWLFMLGSMTCMMPVVVQSAVENAMIPAGCDEMTHQHHVDQQKIKADVQKKDCALKPCLDSQQNTVFNGKTTKLDIPVFIFFLIGLITCLFNPVFFRLFPRWQTFNPVNSVPIRYRFCVLLN